jgi:hypothetical protein
MARTADQSRTVADRTVADDGRDTSAESDVILAVENLTKEFGEGDETVMGHC